MDRAKTICNETKKASKLQHVKFATRVNGCCLQNINRKARLDPPIETGRKESTQRCHTHKRQMTTSPDCWQRTACTQSRNNSTDGISLQTHKGHTTFWFKILQIVSARHEEISGRTVDVNGYIEPLFQETCIKLRMRKSHTQCTALFETTGKRRV
jgi:hypothetical protein